MIFHLCCRKTFFIFCYIKGNNRLSGRKNALLIDGRNPFVCSSQSFYGETKIRQDKHFRGNFFDGLLILIIGLAMIKTVLFSRALLCLTLRSNDEILNKVSRFMFLDNSRDVVITSDPIEYYILQIQTHSGVQHAFALLTILKRKE